MDYQISIPLSSPVINDDELGRLLAGMGIKKKQVTPFSVTT
jgi:hypothetical protein